ncbi:MAG: hypothetical protein DYG98_01730 [Haliscomenobacteraceae bacterium CHB4]|nr:hypothetical protein [Haliscomenobacteraceae bacterium CHB4]
MLICGFVEQVDRYEDRENGRVYINAGKSICSDAYFWRSFSKNKKTAIQNATTVHCLRFGFGG